jgi:uncharacterized protein (DUF58 family)
MPVRSRSTFPLVPKHRLAGLPFGGSRSLRRGHGTDVAGSRAYVPGDPISTIDWRATARLSSARGSDEFVVRERFAEEAPRVIVLLDRRPSMALYPPPFPWLSKPAVVRAATESIVASADSAHAPVGYLDYAGAAASDGEPFWIKPSGRSMIERIETRQEEAPAYDAPDDGITRGLDFLGRFRAELSSGTFVFVISDFLGPPIDESTWLTASARRWEVVPVVIQDPIWEQSFPLVGGLVLPLSDPATGEVLDARVSRREARARRAANEQRRAALLATLAGVGVDPVLLQTSVPEDVDRTFLDWAERRRNLRNRR